MSYGYTHSITSNCPALSLSPSRFKSHLHHPLYVSTPPPSCLSLTCISLLKMSAGYLSAASVTAADHLGLRTDTLEKLLRATGCVGWKKRTVSNGCRTHCMKTWNPINNKKSETLSYLPPLSEESIAKEVDYMILKGWVPCLEFDTLGEVHRTNCKIPGYYDGRYWTMWKLPMFGCVDSSQVLSEIDECKKAYPNAYIRLLSFDNKHQCQRISFVIQKPTNDAA